MAGNVHRVGSVTGSFQSESPLHPAATEFLTDAFARGWANPQKIHHDSRNAAILLNQAKETIASYLKVQPAQLQFLADPSAGFHIGISGLLRPESKLFYPATSRSEVFSVARSLSEDRTKHLEVDFRGQCADPAGTEEDVLSWQGVNGETGVISHQPADFIGRTFYDLTSAGAFWGLPEGWDVALWDARSWQGPAGLGILGVNHGALWRNPLPHMDSAAPISDFSIPLAIASAIALEAHVQDYDRERSRLLALNQRIRNFLTEQISDVDIAGNLHESLPHLLSFSFLYVDAEQLVQSLERQGFSVDSGSACTSSNMEHSHVLAAMGLLTHGNVRITLKPDVKEESIDAFLVTLKKTVEELRD